MRIIGSSGRFRAGGALIVRAAAQAGLFDGGWAVGHVEHSDIGAGRHDGVDPVENFAAQDGVGTDEQVPYDQSSGTTFQNYTEHCSDNARGGADVGEIERGDNPGAPETPTGRSAPGRRVRADAQRNITAVLDAAKAVFAASGVD